mgnify:CR=1 FL=1
MTQVTSDVAISKHRPLFTQTRQGLENKVVSAKRNNLLLRRLRPGPGGAAAVHETQRPLKWPLEYLGRTGSVSEPLM